MKKTVLMATFVSIILLECLMCFSSINATAEEKYDLSEMNTDELIGICTAIKTEYSSRHESFSFDVPVGTWAVGTNLKQGLYSVNPSVKGNSVYFSVAFSQFGGREVSFSSEADSGIIRHVLLSDGDVLEIKFNGVTLSEGVSYPDFDDSDCSDIPIEISNLNDSELDSIFSDIMRELSDKKVPPITLAGGLWIVGKDIPSGTYDIKAFVNEKNGNYSLEVFSGEGFPDHRSEISMFGYGDRHDTFAANIKLDEGAIIIANGCLATLSSTDVNVYFGP